MARRESVRGVAGRFALGEDPSGCSDEGTSQRWLLSSRPAVLFSPRLDVLVA